MENPTTFYIARHGETEWNLEPRRKQGHLDAPLTPSGIEQTKATADILKDIQLDAIYASDLGRTMRTAEILRLNRPLPIIPDQSLRERTLGKYDGMLAKEYKKHTQELWDQYDNMSPEDQWKFKLYERYESDEELTVRFSGDLTQLADKYPGQTLLIVTHGGPIRAFLAGLGLAAIADLKGGTFKNVGYIIAQFNGENFTLGDVQGYQKRD